MFKYPNHSLIKYQLVTKMGEIKIIVSDVMDNRIEEISQKVGIKKTEYVKGLVIEDLKGEK